MDDNGWQEYKQLVLQQIHDVKLSVAEMDKRITDIRQIDVPAIRVEIAMLKIQAGLWGALAGIIPSLLAVGWIILRHGF